MSRTSRKTQIITTTVSKNYRKSSKQIINRFTGYYLNDVDCTLCLHYVKNSKGIKLCLYSVCLYEAEKEDAIKNGRIKRPYKLTVNLIGGFKK